jgi:organic radical activating enzyme
MGYPFVLADPDQIKEIKDLMDKFTEQNIEIRCETTFEIWDAIKGVLENAVNPMPLDDMPDMEIETDRG